MCCDNNSDMTHKAVLQVGLHIVLDNDSPDSAASDTRSDSINFWPGATFKNRKTVTLLMTHCQVVSIVV